MGAAATTASGRKKSTAVVARAELEDEEATAGYGREPPRLPELSLRMRKPPPDLVGSRWAEEAARICRHWIWSEATAGAEVEASATRKAGRPAQRREAEVG